MKAFFARLGGWRTDLLWRFFGLVLYEAVLLYGAHVYGPDLFLEYGLHYAIPAAALLIGAGARVSVLLATTVLMVARTIPFVFENVERQVGEELILYCTLPAMGALLALLARVDVRRGAPPPDEDAGLEARVTGSHAALFRIAAVTTLVFATVHKLNTDFFDRAVSCAAVLSPELSEWWKGLPALLTNVSPLQVVVGEALVPLLLLTYPRLGMAATSLVVGAIGHRGATAFSMLTFVLAASFLYERDGRVLAAGLRRHWGWLLVAVLFTAPLSARSFVGHRPWYEFHVFQVTMLLMLVAAAYLIARDWSAVLHARRAGEPGRLRELLVVRRRDDGFRAAGPASRVALVAFALLAVLNGLSPYLGFKYRLSFAMLSNLRVDDARWNSLLVPRAFRLTAHDPFVHVTAVRMDARAQAELDALARRPTRGLYPGLFAPMSFKYRLKHAEYYGATLDLELTYAGERYVFRDALDDPAFQRWVASLPDSKMFQEGLALEGPQPCVH